ncbi:MAG: hypothetical protein PHX68_02000 [Alphaproteobacteria bacterium]|nr:hypothetical protein [Alphaproteobacteria bacterium]
MIRFFLIAAGIFAIGTLALDRVLPVTFIGFGYRVQTSLIVIVVAAFALFYALDIVLTPLGWMRKYRMKRYVKQASAREVFWTQAARAALDKDPEAVRAVLKQARSFYAPESTESLLIAGLFQADEESFERLKSRPETELAGLRGLFGYARCRGDFDRMAALLAAARERHASVPWVMDGAWHLAVMQSDWKEAVSALDALSSARQVSKAEYARRKACLMLKLNRGEEAYRLDPGNPAAALAYAAEKPQKARDILTESWERMPCWDVFAAFAQQIAGEPPARQMKLIEKLVRKNPMHRLSLLAVAHGAAQAQAWGVARETLQAYLETYPPSVRAAKLMARIERDGWHHADAARDWEAKAETAGADAGWACGACGHALRSWEAVCPICHAFGKVGYR